MGGALLLNGYARPSIETVVEPPYEAFSNGTLCGFSVALHGASATMTDLADATTRAAGTEGLVEVMERWLRPIPTTEQT